MSQSFTFDEEDSYIVNVVPCPIPLLSTFTDPPIFSIICLQMLNPKPVPALFIPVVSFNLQKL